MLRGRSGRGLSTDASPRVQPTPTPGTESTVGQGRQGVIYLAESTAEAVLSPQTLSAESTNAPLP